MGTRSLTILQDHEGEDIAVMSRQMDGYIDGHGHELAEFLSGMVITNGIGRQKKSANGADCLAAQIVAHFKTGSGNFYLLKAGTRDAGEEYRYTVKPTEFGGGVITVKVEAVAMYLSPPTASTSGYGENWETIFEGSPEELAEFKEPEYSE